MNVKRKENESRCKVVFVVGVPHSGTTILYRMLARHSDVAWFSQYSMRGGEIPGRARLPFYAIINRMGKEFFPVSWKKKYGSKGTYSNRPGLVPTPTEPHKIWDHLLPANNTSPQFFSEVDATQDTISRMRAICFAECRAWSKQYLLVKLPRLSQAVKLLAHVFPEALFIHIVRDGRAVALSNASKFAKEGAPKNEALEESALYWKSSEEYLREARSAHSDKFMSVSYESFCGDIHANMAKIIDFIGLAHSAQFLDTLPRRLTATNDTWLTDLSHAEKNLLNRILQPMLEKQGYKAFDI